MDKQKPDALKLASVPIFERSIGWQADATATLKEQAAEIRHLRELLAVRVAGALLYADDGELQDNTQHPCIDFRRDTPSEIQRKLQERGLANYRRSLEDEARGLGA